MVLTSSLSVGWEGGKRFDKISTDIYSRMPMTPRGVDICHVVQIHFGDGAKCKVHRLCKMQFKKWFLKNLLIKKERERWELLTFSKLCWSSSIAGSAELKKNWGLLWSKWSYNKHWGFQPCVHWEFSIWIEFGKVRIAMISKNKPLYWDVMSLPITQLVKVLLAWQQEDQVLPKILNRSRWFKLPQDLN